MISEQTKKDFNQALKEEFGLKVHRQESDEVLLGLTKYYSQLSRLDHVVKSPHKAQN